ncbi:hypothetical protein [Marinobacter zhejiangensis]|nr:hypothetical protein [Marinobacter zhejiangensis]
MDIRHFDFMPAVTRGVLLGAVLVLSPPVHSDSVAWPDMLSDQELAQLRGGFMLGDLEIFIGLEQVVAINGENLVLTRLTIPDLNQQFDPGELADVLETSLTVPESSLPAGLVIATDVIDNGGILTRVQNSLDETVIQTLRQLNIEFNNLNAARFRPGNQDATYLQMLHPR